jgi:hypothetical protein
MSDLFFARIFHVLGAIVPIGTVSMTTVFHADSADLVAESTTMVLGAADANSFHKSFSDQTGELWSPNGRCSPPPRRWSTSKPESHRYPEGRIAAVHGGYAPIPLSYSSVMVRHLLAIRHVSAVPPRFPVRRACLNT